MFPNCNQLVLDFDAQSKQPLITVDEKLAEHLKPHQKDGIKFMWNACFESSDVLNESTGGGCILAHCMGVGESKLIIIFPNRKTKYMYSLFCCLYNK